MRSSQKFMNTWNQNMGCFWCKAFLTSGGRSQHGSWVQCSSEHLPTGKSMWTTIYIPKWPIQVLWKPGERWTNSSLFWYKIRKVTLKTAGKKREGGKNVKSCLHPFSLICKKSRDISPLGDEEQTKPQYQAHCEKFRWVLPTSPIS